MAASKGGKASVKGGGKTSKAALSKAVAPAKVVKGGKAAGKAAQAVKGGKKGR